MLQQEKLGLLQEHDESDIHSLMSFPLRLIGPISYLGACYIRTKVTKCSREKMTMYFRGLTIKSHSSGHEIGPINRSV